METLGIVVRGVAHPHDDESAVRPDRDSRVALSPRDVLVHPEVRPELDTGRVEAPREDVVGPCLGLLIRDDEAAGMARDRRGRSEPGEPVLGGNGLAGAVE